MKEEWVRTSESHPIRVDLLSEDEVRAPGRLGMTFAPGMWAEALGGRWERNLAADHSPLAKALRLVVRTGVRKKNSFKSAFNKRRCLILADGFYEWQRNQSGSGSKQPYYIRLETGAPYAFAGLWESWEGEDGAGNKRTINSTTIITTGANELVGSIHNRMPVILAPEAYPAWLDTSIQNPGERMPLLAPYPSVQMEAYPVSTHVNRPANDDPGCIEPVGAGG